MRHRLTPLSVPYPARVRAGLQALGLSKSAAGLVASANYAGYFCGALLAAQLRLGGSRRAWLLGARTQTSRGRITGDGIAPLRFGDRYRSEQAAHFQRDKGVISFSSNAPDAPLRLLAGPARRRCAP